MRVVRRTSVGIHGVQSCRFNAEIEDALIPPLSADFRQYAGPWLQFGYRRSGPEHGAAGLVSGDRIIDPG